MFLIVCVDVLKRVIAKILKRPGVNESVSEWVGTFLAIKIHTIYSIYFAEKSLDSETNQNCWQKQTAVMNQFGNNYRIKNSLFDIGLAYRGS